MGLIVRLLLIVSSAITGLFVTQEAHNFPIISMFVSIALLTVFAAIVAFWPAIKRWIKYSD